MLFKLRIGKRLTVLALALTASAHGAQIVSTWLGGSGNWNDPAKWSGGIVPNNGANTYAVNIDGGSPSASVVTWVSYANPPLPSIALDGLTIDPNDQLSVLTFGSLTIGGPLVINGTLQYSQGLISIGDGHVSGSGSIVVLGDDANGGIFAASGALTVDSGITVIGKSNAFYPSLVLVGVGNPAASLINKGRFVADGGGLLISGSSLDNQGTIETKNGGVLIVNTTFTLSNLGNFNNVDGTVVIRGTLENTGQTLTIHRNNEWQLAGRVHGGTMGTDGPVFSVPYLSSATLDAVELNATVTVNGNLTILNGISGTGTIALGNPEAIEGSGNISIPIIATGITLRGGMSASFSDPAKGKITLDTNQGILRAQKSVFNDGGILKLLSFSGTTIQNAGELQISDLGTFQCMASLAFSTNSKLTVDGGGELDITGDLDLSHFDILEVHPKAGGGSYSNFIIATFTGTRTGTFNSVTPGIAVSYLTAGQIKITGTPVPEPATAVLLLPLALLLQRRREKGSP